MKITPLAKNITIAPEADGEIIVKYDLKGEERQDNFSCSATVDNSCIALGDIKENAAETTFTLPIKAVAEEGFATVEFELVNGEFSKTCQVRVSIDTPSEFTGWNVDVIAESTPADKFTTGSYDNDGWALYTTDVQEKVLWHQLTVSWRLLTAHVLSLNRMMPIMPLSLSVISL